MPQAHDLGVIKRKTGRQPLDRDRLAYLRAKRRHPGPLPDQWRRFRTWLEAGKPSTDPGVRGGD